MPALLALLDNARRHAVPGTIRIQNGQQDGRCFLRVEDNGPGIPEALASQVFTAFRRASPARSSARDGGSGLGLAVVAAIAHAHGGQATCRPSSEGGACFELSWPVAQTAG